MPMHTFSTIFWAAAKVFGRKGSINHRNASWQIDFWSNKKLPFLSAGAQSSLTACQLGWGFEKLARKSSSLQQNTRKRGCWASSFHLGTLQHFAFVIVAGLNGWPKFISKLIWDWMKIREPPKRQKHICSSEKLFKNARHIFFPKQDSCLFWIWN